MALVDFCQLITLHELRRRADPGLLSTHPHPTPSRLPSSEVQPRKPPSSLPPMPPPLKTPESKRGASCPAPDPTPLSHPSFVCPRQESDTDEVEEYDYEEARGDLRSRVFVDFEVYMKHVLHAPDDWKTRWGPAIEATKTDFEFRKYHEEHRRHCGKSGSQEASFYEPLMNTAEAVLDVLSRPTSDRISSQVPQPHRVDGPKKPGEKEDPQWAEPLYLLEVKACGSAICDGTNMPRLVVGEVDPISNHALPSKPSQYVRGKSTSLVTPTTVSEPTPGPSKPSKRPADESSTTSQPTKKKPRTESAVDHILDDSASSEIGEEDERSSTPESETHYQVDPAIQICHYFLKQFCDRLFYSHATIGLVDCDRLQLYYANRSVILVSSAINILEDDGLNKFIAVITAFRYLSFKRDTIPDALTKVNGELVENSGIPVDKVVERGNRLDFLGSGSQDKFTVDLGGLISRDIGMVGRSTAVLEATSDRWAGTELVVKISWPRSGRGREMDFVKKATDEAEKTAGQWAAKHLPRVFYAKDIVFGKSSALESVACLFEDGKVINKSYMYERRTLRVMIQERLYALESLTNARDIGQVFLDAACVHRWLYEHPGILHCDLSPNNIMYRFVEEMNGEGGRERKVHGVLTDYDLSSWREDLYDCTGSSQQRMGTPMYMAEELLSGTSNTHLYRHDVESLFYIMLMICGRCTFSVVNGGAGKDAKRQVVVREGKLPYQRWFDIQYSWTILGSLKNCFFMHLEDIELSPPFEDFRPWLTELHYELSEGFMKKRLHRNNCRLPRRKQKQAEPTPVPPFDNDTLNGHVDYSSLIKPTRDLKGELEGLIIRYDTASPPLPTPDNPSRVQTN